MNYIEVLKFGGSSQANAEGLKNVVELISEAKAKGRVAVVVSAQGDSTDWLLEAAEAAVAGDLPEAMRLAARVRDQARDSARDTSLLIEAPLGPELGDRLNQLSDRLHDILKGVHLLRELSDQAKDLVMSFGERMSIEVLAHLLTAHGTPAVAIDSRSWVATDDHFGSAFVDWERTEAQLAEVRASWGDKLPVHTGFLGRTADGRTTTLGRNGSDYTASMLARGLGAKKVSIWTAVSGVMTADPTFVDEAYPVSSLTYMEALELANFGARMFHPRTMIPLIESGIPLYIRNTMRRHDPGTRVDAGGASNAPSPTCVTSLERLALIEVDAKRVAGALRVGQRVLRALNDAGIEVWMATQAGHGQAVSTVVPSASLERAKSTVEAELAVEISRGDVGRVFTRANISLLTLVAEVMGRESNVAGRLFGALGSVGIPVWGIAQSGSSRSISCVIDAERTQEAVRTVHASFNLANKPVNVLMMGIGVVGGEMIAQIHKQQKEWTESQGINLQVVGITNRGHSLFDPKGLDLAHWREELDAAPHQDAIQMLDELRRLPLPILVDCTASGGMEKLYLEAFQRGIHVVAANKKPLTIPWEARQELFESARRAHRAYHYETTVGASLPILDTLMGMVQTGDKIRQIDGSLSGTLGYLCCKLMDGALLSEAVREAHSLGYTEPHPKDDLSGTDAARKALILARELGVSLEYEDVRVEPLVPSELLAEEDLERFFKGLESYDATMKAKIEAMKAKGESLRYLARIVPDAERSECLSVGPFGVDAEHAATRLRGTQSFMAFFTERYAADPLIVQGAGAGGPVTAAGVLADVLKIGLHLRGH